MKQTSLRRNLLAALSLATIGAWQSATPTSAFAGAPMRDEAHRFGITHHRGKRSKRIVRTALQDIPGIGPETARKLIVRFGSIKGVQEASLDQLIAEVGERKAALLKERLNAQ